jgi:hypothetical protein
MNIFQMLLNALLSIFGGGSNLSSNNALATLGRNIGGNSGSSNGLQNYNPNAYDPNARINPMQINSNAASVSGYSKNGYRYEGQAPLVDPNDPDQLSKLMQMSKVYEGSPSGGKCWAEVKDLLGAAGYLNGSRPSTGHAKDAAGDLKAHGFTIVRPGDNMALASIPANAVRVEIYTGGTSGHVQIQRPDGTAVSDYVQRGPMSSARTLTAIAWKV